MLAVFDKSVAQSPDELKSPNPESVFALKDGNLAQHFSSVHLNAVTINLAQSGFISYSSDKQNPLLPRLFAVVDDIFCLFEGHIENFAPLKQQYGLSQTGNEANIIVEAYRSLRDRGPYPIEHVIRDIHGKFAFILYDSASKNSFVAADPDGSVPLFWGADSEGHLVVSDDAETVKQGCGKSFAPFPKADAMSKITASKTAAAMLRASLMQQSCTDSPNKGAPLSGTPRASSSQQPDPKTRRTTVASSPGSSRKTVAAEKQPATSSKTPAGPPRTGPQEPDLVEVAKSMIKAVPPSEREAVRGVGTLDLDGIAGVLAEALLRVNGLRKPLDRKNKEAQATAAIRAQLEAAQKRNSELEATVTNLKAEFKPLRQKMLSYEVMEKSLTSVKERLVTQEKSLTKELSEKAEQEKRELVREMMEDSSQIQRMTWSRLFPSADFASWEKTYRQCSETYNQEILAAAENEAFEEGLEVEEQPVVALVPLGGKASKKNAAEAESSKKNADQADAANVEDLPPS